MAGARVAICVCARCWAACAWRGSAPEARTGEDAQLASRTKMWLRRQPRVPVTVGCTLHQDPEADPEAGGHAWPPCLAPPWPRTPAGLWGSAAARLQRTRASAGLERLLPASFVCIPCVPLPHSHSLTRRCTLLTTRFCRLLSAIRERPAAATACACDPNALGLAPSWVHGREEQRPPDGRWLPVNGQLALAKVKSLAGKRVNSQTISATKQKM